MHQFTMNPLLRIAAVALLLTSISVHAQMGGRGGGMGGANAGPQFTGSMAKLFGDNSAFSAQLEMQMPAGRNGGAMTMPGKLAFSEGKARFEMNMSEMKGGGMPAGAAEQMKAMGMDSIVSITRPDKKVTYQIYPGLQAYAESALQDPDAGKPDSDFKVEVTELGKETIEGQACIKNKVTVTDKEGTKHESTVWNATELKKFPVKIETAERGTTITMLFKEVKLAKPDAALFDPPTDYKKYDNVMAMMQQEMMKRMGGAQGMPGR
jgi:hypothetical protein